ncbi:MAG: hypothetical protein FWD69_19215 [Polyangiaceae bacterium]|nr:hypothetical protein [Polyangiaceae bacterium]
MSPIRGIVFFTLGAAACTVFTLTVASVTACRGFDPVDSGPDDDAGQYVVSTLAGTGDAGANDGPGNIATFNAPFGIAVGPDGNLYVGDDHSYKIRKVAIDGTVSLYAGTGSFGQTNTNNNCASATFANLHGIAVDKTGNVYVSDHNVRMITSTSGTCQQVSTLAGNGTNGFADDTGTAASFNSPWGLAVDTSGNVYVADNGNNKIRKVTSAGVVSTVAGTGVAGHSDGAAMSATFNAPVGIAVDVTEGALYVAEGNNNDIRKITFDGMGNPQTVSTLAGSGALALKDGVGLDAAFNSPTGLAIDANENLYVADTGNNAIRIISLPAAEVKTIAGTGATGADDGPADHATFNNPRGVTVSAGIVYVADTTNNKIRKITPVLE